VFKGQIKKKPQKNKTNPSAKHETPQGTASHKVREKHHCKSLEKQTFLRRKQIRKALHEPN
jgi:hypothetical protein